MTFATIEHALEQLRSGRPVLVLDDEDRENEGDAILAAELASPQWVGWMVRHTSGYLCAPMEDTRADRLGLPLMWSANTDPLRTRYTVSVDAATSTTGISSVERAATTRALADPRTTSADLIRPGHVLPLRARDGGVLTRRGHTEAAVDLTRLAGLQAVGLIGEIVHDDGTCARTPDVLALGQAEGLDVITIESLANWRRSHEEQPSTTTPGSSTTRVSPTVSAQLPTRHGVFTMTGYHDQLTGAEHVLLVAQRGLGDERQPLVRVHSECLTGDAFGSLRCDCGEQLQTAMQTVSEHGGAVILLRGQEGRGVGLLSKIAAYHVQDSGLDTVDAQTTLGLPVDAREYGAAVAILRDQGIDAVRLLTNNPDKVTGLRAGGITVEQVGLQIDPHTHDIDYLRTKRDRMGHLLTLPAESDNAPAATADPDDTDVPDGPTDKEIS